MLQVPTLVCQRGGALEDPLTCQDRGKWQDPPDYVRWSASMSRCKLRTLACFRVAAHDLEVETRKWERVGGARVSLPRAERVCKLCGVGVGDELHMIAECTAYAAVRQRHAHLFECLGGWQQVVHRAVSSADMRQFMSQQQHMVASFLYECSQRRWQNPPAELVEAVGDGDAAVEDDEEIIEAALAGADDMFPDDLLDDL